MSDKLQTVYIPTEKGEVIPFKSIQLNGRDFYKQVSGYFFTPEELNKLKRDVASEVFDELHYSKGNIGGHSYQSHAKDNLLDKLYPIH